MKNKNALKSLLLVLAFVVSLFAGVSDAFADGAWYPGSKTEIIQLVAVNDFHGNVLESSSNPGIAKIAGILDEMRDNRQTFFFSAGDNYQGTAISNLTKGEVVGEAFELMDLKASAIGNHEYDWGKDLMNTWTKDGGYPFLASNIVYKDSGEPVDYADPYYIQDVKLSTGKTVKIGVIGLATPETATKTLLANVADIDFTDPVEAANKWTRYLLKTEKVDAIVALTHLGGFQDKETKEIDGELKEFAEGVKDVDVIFSGHTHQLIDGEVNGIPILQGYYNGRGLQVAELEFNNRNRKLVSVETYVDHIASPERKPELPINEEVAALVKTYEDELSGVLNEVIGENAATLEHDSEMGLTPLGQWSAKTLADIGETQIAIINGGGIREPLPAGDITMGTMYSIFPFDNTLVTMEVTGDILYRLIEHGIDPADFRDGQFYGVKVTYDLSQPYGSRIVDMTLEDGTEIDRDETYTLSTLDFIYTGGDKYDFTGATNVFDTFKPVRDAIVEYIEETGTVNHTYDPTAYVAE